MKKQKKNLYLLFNVDEERYALSVKDILTVIPFVNLRFVPGLPSYIAGIFNFRNTVVPVIDMAILFKGHSSRRQLSTRIILLNYIDNRNEQHTLGIVAEKVTDFVRLTSQSKPLLNGMGSKDANYVDSFNTDDYGVVVGLNAHQLLPMDVQESLFSHCMPGNSELDECRVE